MNIADQLRLKHRRQRFQWWILPLIVVPIALGWWLASGGAENVGGMFDGDSRHRLIANWIKENNSDGDFTIVRWYPPIEKKTYVNSNEKHIVVRVKWRETNPFGAKGLRDECFRLENGKITRILTPNEKMFYDFGD